MSWTDWQILATENEWYSDSLNWKGAACYELALAGSRKGNLKVMYVGETSNAKTRLAKYARSGSHLGREISNGLSNGRCLWFRISKKETKKEAKAMQDRLLDRKDYPWNIVGD